MPAASASASLTPGQPTLAATAQVLNNPGGVDMGRYPLLVHTIRDGDNCIVTESGGVPVADIVAAFAVQPDVAAMVARFNVSAAHINDALKYAAERAVPST